MFTVVPFLFIIGLIMGSFASAWTWRVHQGRSISHGRSACPSCGHKLSAIDLVPLLSWLWLGGRCRYCRTPISLQDPILEVLTGLFFAVSYLLWPGGIHSGAEGLLFITWLLSGVGLLALAVSDIRWMLLPNKVIYPVLAVAAAGRIVYITGFEPHRLQAAEQWLISLLVTSGFFWLLFMASSGKWIGYGDVRLGLITGTLLATPAKALLMLVLASFAGTLFTVPMLALGRHHWGSKIPYGPFLIFSTAITMLFGSGIIDWYKNLVVR